ncbi:MAG TPA: hypothetical protein VHG28_25280 [Longimicrobiaceae bacterium]|nr:hypothetical protein [Longimicrobiaceae bacterium]
MSSLARADDLTTERETIPAARDFYAETGREPGYPGSREAAAASVSASSPYREPDPPLPEMPAVQPGAAPMVPARRPTAPSGGAEVMQEGDAAAPAAPRSQRRPLTVGRAAIRPALLPGETLASLVRPRIDPQLPLSESLPARRPEEEPQQPVPTIRVSIGRIELRGTPPAVAPTGSAAPRRRAGLSLEEYLQQRAGARR